jgi:hypothetical protein
LGPAEPVVELDVPEKLLPLPRLSFDGAPSFGADPLGGVPVEIAGLAMAPVIDTGSGNMPTAFLSSLLAASLAVLDMLWWCLIMTIP